MEQLDSRRYTGPNLVWDRAGAVMDVACSPAEAERLVPLWQEKTRALLDALDWGDEQTAVHHFDTGVSLALSAPIDALYAATAVNECAWQTSLSLLASETPASFGAEVTRLRELIAEEANPDLIRLQRAAREHGVAFLSDDDEASVGLGRGVKVWPVSALPAPQAVDWKARISVPVGLVTGTNGKTTSVRLAAAIVRAAGLNVGLSSTDWVGVNDEIIDRGDYSGPGGARAALRHPAVDVAILETARGGLLRRGLGVEHADAALITNIAEDHLGDFGSQSIAELLAVKWVVTRALAADSHAVLNADDERLVDQAGSLRCPIIWFALAPDNAVVAAQVAAGGPAFSVVAGELARFDGRSWRPICAIDDIPLTLNGAARHNVANALAAAALTRALGLSDEAIAAGLGAMTAADNPGRCNLFNIDGVEVLLDFAHNPQGMEAIFALAGRRPAKRRALAFGQAGDRTDASIKELARVAWKIGLDRVIVSELEDYHRGRAPGEVYGLLRDQLVTCGAGPEQIGHNRLEMESLNEALGWARPGDLVIMLALGDTKNILARLRELSGGMASPVG